VEGAVVGALDAVAAALQAGEGLLGVLEGSAEHFVWVTVCDTLELVLPEVGFGLAEAAKHPLGIEEEIQGRSVGVLWLPPLRRRRKRPSLKSRSFGFRVRRRRDLWSCC
jgi:hypothetical protein